MRIIKLLTISVKHLLHFVTTLPIFLLWLILADVGKAAFHCMFIKVRELFILTGGFEYNCKVTQKKKCTEYQHKRKECGQVSASSGVVPESWVKVVKKIKIMKNRE